MQDLLECVSLILSQVAATHAETVTDASTLCPFPSFSLAYTNYRSTVLAVPLLASAGLLLTRSPPQINIHTRRQIHPAPNQLVLLGARALEPSPYQCPRQTCLQVLPCNHLGSHACMHQLVAAQIDLPAAGKQLLPMGLPIKIPSSAELCCWRLALPSHAGPSLAFVASA